jgi:hypothetical protein
MDARIKITTPGSSQNNLFKINETLITVPWYFIGYWDILRNQSPEGRILTNRLWMIKFVFLFFFLEFYTHIILCIHIYICVKYRYCIIVCIYIYIVNCKHRWVQTCPEVSRIIHKKGLTAQPPPERQGKVVALDVASLSHPC